jgi:hypothetical protein
MEITRTLVAGAMGLALVVGGVGCGAAADRAADEAIDAAVDQAAADSGCEDLDIDPDGSASGTCGDVAFDVDADAATGGDVSVESDAGGFAIGSGADLPEGWPTDLAVIEGLDVLYATSDSLGLNVTGNLDGDLDEISEQVRSDVEAAGFTISEDVTEDEGDGRMGTDITATDGTFEARLGITETPNDPRGGILVVYFLEPLA